MRKHKDRILYILILLCILALIFCCVYFSSRHTDTLDTESVITDTETDTTFDIVKSDTDPIAENFIYSDLEVDKTTISYGDVDHNTDTLFEFDEISAVSNEGVINNIVRESGTDALGLKLMQESGLENCEVYHYSVDYEGDTDFNVTYIFKDIPAVDEQCNVLAYMFDGADDMRRKDSVSVYNYEDNGKSAIMLDAKVSSDIYLIVEVK